MQAIAFYAPVTVDGLMQRNHGMENAAADSRQSLRFPYPAHTFHISLKIIIIFLLI